MRLDYLEPTPSEKYICKNKVFVPTEAPDLIDLLEGLWLVGEDAFWPLAPVLGPLTEKAGCATFSHC